MFNCELRSFRRPGLFSPIETVMHKGKSWSFAIRMSRGGDDQHSAIPLPPMLSRQSWQMVEGSTGFLAARLCGGFGRASKSEIARNVDRHHETPENPNGGRFAGLLQDSGSCSRAGADCYQRMPASFRRPSLSVHRGLVWMFWEFWATGRVVKRMKGDGRDGPLGGSSSDDALDDRIRRCQEHPGLEPLSGHPADREVPMSGFTTEFHEERASARSAENGVENLRVEVSTPARRLPRG